MVSAQIRRGGDASRARAGFAALLWVRESCGGGLSVLLVGQSRLLAIWQSVYGEKSSGRSRDETLALQGFRLGGTGQTLLSLVLSFEMSLQ